MAKLILFDAARARNRARLQSVAGAGQRLQNQYQAPRVLRQFLGGAGPTTIGRRERLKPSVVLQVIRERLAESEFPDAA